MDFIADDFKKYSANSTLIIMAAAVCIGIATKDIIERFMNDVILPLIMVGTKTSILYRIYNYLLRFFSYQPIITALLKGLGTTFWLFIVWSVIIFITFVFFKKLLEKNFVTQQLKMFNKAKAIIDEKISSYQSP